MTERVAKPDNDTRGIVARAFTLVEDIVYVGLGILLAIGAAKLPRLDAVPFDTRILLFSLATLVVVGAIIGLAPAIRLKRSDMKTLMNDSSRSSSAGDPENSDAV